MPLWIQLLAPAGNLEKAGLKTENIIDSGLCSVCNKDLIHSFRVEKQGYGLNTALIALK